MLLAINYAQNYASIIGKGLAASLSSEVCPPVSLSSVVSAPASLSSEVCPPASLLSEVSQCSRCLKWFHHVCMALEEQSSMYGVEWNCHNS